jgi:hypothetical protein
MTMRSKPPKKSQLILSRMNSINYLSTLIVAFLLVITIGSVFTKERVDTDNFALGKHDFNTAEHLQGITFTGSSIREIKAVFDKLEPCRNGTSIRVMWLGNSQLHTINQYRQGDHLAPYWLYKSAKNANCFWPYGLSLPNANFQEYLALTAFVTSVTNLDAAVISLVFDDLREDGLRPDFSTLMSEKMRANLFKSEAGQQIQARFDRDHARTQGGNEENSGLEGFVQKRFEDSLNDTLSQLFPIWAERPNLRALLITNLYNLRNFALEIKSTSIRKQIPARRLRNMSSLEAAIQFLRKQGIPVILYIAPIRQDVPLPYDQAEYLSWKQEIVKLAALNDSQILNLESLVPSNKWGTYVADDVDFMHFQGDGHFLLAQAISIALSNAIGDF